MKPHELEKQEEKIFLQALERLSYKAENQYCCVGTGFYNSDWMKTVIRAYKGQKYLEHLTFSGGYLEAERQMVIFGIDNAYPNQLPLVVLKIEVKTGIGKPLTHRDFLGALLGLGIVREKIGDIIIMPFGAYVVVDYLLETYITLNLTTVGKYNTTNITTIPLEDLQVPKLQTKEIKGTVAHLRADAVLALGFSMSRSAVVKLIDQDKAKCNGRLIKAAQTVSVGDVLTLRGYGKIRLIDQGGLSRKDRMHITIQKYV